MTQGTNHPIGAGSTTYMIAAGTTTANVSIGAGNTGETVLVYNSSAVLVHVAFGNDNTVAAVASGAATPQNSIPVPPSTSRMIGITSLTKFAAVIAASGSANNVYFTRGNGSTY